MRTVRLLAGKDLRTLGRSKGLVVLLVLYPLVIALLIGSLLMNASEGARIGFVNEDSSGTLRVGDQEFGVDRYRAQAEQGGVEVIDFNSRSEAAHALDEGQVAGVLVIPPRFIERLKSGLQSSELEFFTGDNALGNIITQRMRGVIYRINLKISQALIDINTEYLDALAAGGPVNVDGTTYDLYGLHTTQQTLTDVRSSLSPAERDEVDKIIRFADLAETALAFAKGTLNETAAPVRLHHERSSGKSPQLTARAMSFALAVSIAFICVIFVGASLAGERDEHVLGRLIRGIAHGWQVIASKLLLGVALAAAFSLGLFAVFAVLAPQAWARLPLLLGAVVLAAVAFSAVGSLLATLTRDARTATLVGLLVVLPLIPMSLLGSNPVAFWISQLFPLSPAQDLFNSTLFDLRLQRKSVIDAGQLVVIALVASTAARRLLGRLA